MKDPLQQDICFAENEEIMEEVQSAELQNFLNQTPKLPMKRQVQEQRELNGKSTKQDDPSSITPKIMQAKKHPCVREFKPGPKWYNSSLMEGNMNYTAPYVPPHRRNKQGALNMAGSCSRPP
ncbi:OLC1v1024517C1 [Oldenlandia corymbosa var. corymbosa]|uniref:OLC1v1024517C1 n=1 Tax=Oldenlandia corymbosa var. corymbosa TaxID=529605 RepID=A0AAV1C3W2_OLDCO|nr:OLC1v1024517C1 [Oldenlandia corymbosa var. corymbosa]